MLVAALACGLPDQGVFSDLDAKVSLQLPELRAGRLALRVDNRHHVATLYRDGDAVYAWSLPRRVETYASLPDEMRHFVAPPIALTFGVPARAEDHDGDGIVDALDVLVGARKLLYNHARYFERYLRMKYPGGDVPRSEGVCTDTVVRALRNAGIDLQKELHEDILRAPAAYPMVKNPDPNIDQRRVRTLLPWFRRHWRALPKDAPYLPGDVVFFDTFPSRPGPDHIGIVSDRRGATELPLVINNWTDGAVDAEMDLLPSIPVTHHFRAGATPPAPAGTRAAAIAPAAAVSSTR